MSIILAISLLVGALLNPHLPVDVSLYNAIACPTLWGESLAVCAIEFSDHISPTYQDYLRDKVNGENTLLVQWVDHFASVGAWGMVYDTLRTGVLG